MLPDGFQHRPSLLKFAQGRTMHPNQLPVSGCRLPGSGIQRFAFSVQLSNFLPYIFSSIAPQPGLRVPKGSNTDSNSV
jgi:hypothetical protein